MPRVPDKILRSVVVLLNEGGTPCGSAFIVEYHDTSLHVTFYLITCHHCVLKRITARFCNGSTLIIEPSEWTIAVSGDDIAILPLEMGYSEDGRSAIDLLDENLYQAKSKFYVGDDIYMLGLLVDEKDIGRNVPRARFGNISALPDDEVLMLQGNSALRPCYLGDMRSRAGFSGSPVIACHESSALDGYTKYHHSFVGIHSAQAPERFKLVGHDGFVAAEIPSSLTRIVPAWEVSRAVATETTLIAYRKRRRQADGWFDEDETQSEGQTE